MGHGIPLSHGDLVYQRASGMPVWDHVSMSDATVDKLRDAVRTYRRAKAAQEKARLALRQAILDAAAADKGPAEITRLIDHEYTEKHVSRIIHGKA